MSNSCKICTHHWISDRPATTTLASDLDYVIMSSCKVKNRDAGISETDLITGFFPTISDNILPTQQITQTTLWSSSTIIFERDQRRVEDISMHFTGSQWNCLKLTTWFGSVAADILVLPLRKKIHFTKKLIFNMLVNEHLWILTVTGLGLLSVIFSGILNRR